MEYLSSTHRSRLDNCLGALHATLTSHAFRRDADAQKIMALFDELRAEEERGSRAAHGARWLDNKRTGHINLARAQARRFMETVAAEQISFTPLQAAVGAAQEPGTVTSPEGSLVFLETIKAFLDEPNFQQIYGDRGDQAATSAARSARAFAEDIVCAFDYDVVAHAAHLPPAPLSAEQIPPTYRQAWRREDTFYLWQSELAYTLAERGLTRQQISDELVLKATLIKSRIDTGREQRDKAQTTEALQAIDQPRHGTAYPHPVERPDLVTPTTRSTHIDGEPPANAARDALPVDHASTQLEEQSARLARAEQLKAAADRLERGW